MVDNDYNIIKPVETLQNITGLNPIMHRDGRKRRQNMPSGHKEEHEKKLSESEVKENRTDRLINDEDENDQHSIDYCA